MYIMSGSGRSKTWRTWGAMLRSWDLGAIRGFWGTTLFQKDHLGFSVGNDGVGGHAESMEIG